MYCTANHIAHRIAHHLSSHVKTIKDPCAPKRPQTVFALWLKDNRDRIKTEVAIQEAMTGSSGGLMKEAGKQWKAVSDAEKTPYLEMVSICSV